MKIITDPEEVFSFVWELRSQGQSIGLVPTMGALHEGHLSLVAASRQRCDHTIATLFVNPTQFAPGEDLDKYPRTFDQDAQSLRELGATALFCPAADRIYPDGFSTYVSPPKVAETLEGEFRPVHFQGVATVVLKLFHLLPATHAFFGLKDYQQYRVIDDMVRDLNVPIEVVPCPTVRESDGLAMSSRNRYLRSSERQRALCLSRALKTAVGHLDAGETDPGILTEWMRKELTGEEGNLGVDEIDYAVVRDSRTLEELSFVDDQAVFLVAARLGKTRLIDNAIWHRGG